MILVMHGTGLGPMVINGEVVQSISEDKFMPDYTVKQGPYDIDGKLYTPVDIPDAKRLTFSLESTRILVNGGEYVAFLK